MIRWRGNDGRYLQAMFIGITQLLKGHAVAELVEQTEILNHLVVAGMMAADRIAEERFGRGYARVEVACTGKEIFGLGKQREWNKNDGAKNIFHKGFTMDLPDCVLSMMKLLLTLFRWAEVPEE
ncbi:MAG: hypothetical protein N2747_11385 [Chitinophagaceae bacterium]|nr:hypothetical protein [Chitinophagaceae bacterium]